MKMTGMKMTDMNMRTNGHELIDRIIDKCESSSVDWKEEASGNRSLPVQQTDLNAIGKQNLLYQARSLEEKGLIRCRWIAGKSDISAVCYSLKDRETFYRLAGRVPKALRIRQLLDIIEKHRENACKEWIRAWYDELAEQTASGKEPDILSEGKRELYLKCIDGLDRLTDSVYKRIFSKQCLGDSKIFERELEGRVISAARKHCDTVDDNMSGQEILSQLYIDEYSPELALKGNLLIELEDRQIDLSLFKYGALLNSETMKRAVIPPGQKIRRIITVENKANYMSFSYEEGTLILFSHGYFSPLEKEFLISLCRSLYGKDTEYFHTGDLDYGGVRIFKYIRTKIFPELKPYLMDTETYKRYRAHAAKIEPQKLEKLRKLEEPLLHDLIEMICGEGKGIEQESFLFGLGEEEAEQ